ncbi:MAG: SPFH/Band 7/PHB domain protein, partial [Candidatus Margulisbacteria bacterium]|nr:SPFH/Band 7/PHB domain protein [Candidatus Margulisiibacteriota bacterium]
LKQIDPPKDVQETMNKIVKAENEKIAAIDFATAAETAADGQKRAAIKQAKILEAEGEAEFIRLVNESANKYFIGNAQLLKRLEATQSSLEHNTKVIVPANSDLVNVVGELAGIIPLKEKK